VIDLRLAKTYLPITGHLVRLKVFTEANITDTYLSWLNDPEVVKFSNQRFLQHTSRTSLDYLKSFDDTENLLMAVYLKDTEKYIGTMSVYSSVAHETADIGIMIGDKAYWNSGVGGDAWSTALSFLLAVLKIRKVTGGTLECNTGMVKIMMKSGMKPDGVRIAHELIDHQPHNVLYFAKFLG
jgi:RimJ/RimL family protein N-acetyltransferase